MDSEFAEAVAVLNDPESEQGLQQQALEYLRAFEDGEDGWKVCVEAIENGETDDLHTLFQRFKIISSVAKKRGRSLCASGDIMVLKEFLVGLLDVIGQYPYAVLNKSAQLYAHVFSAAYVDAWPSFFQDIASVMFSEEEPALYTLFLRIIHAIDEVVVARDAVRTSDELDRNAAIKNKMREGDAEIVVGTLADIIEQTAGGDDELASEAFDVLCELVQWMPITLFISERFSTIVAASLEMTALRDAAVRFLGALIAKGMPIEERLGVLDALDVLKIVDTQANAYLKELESIQKKRESQGGRGNGGCKGRVGAGSGSDGEGESGGELDEDELDAQESEAVASLTEVAQVISALNASLLGGIEAGSEGSEEVVDACRDALASMLPLSILLLGNDDDGVAECVIDSISVYLQLLKSGPVVSDDSANFDAILAATLVKLRFDGTSEFENEEKYALFYVYRNQLKAILTNLRNVDVERLTEMASLFATDVLASAETWMDVELAIYIAFILLEISQDQPYLSSSASTSSSSTHSRQGSPSAKGRTIKQAPNSRRDESGALTPFGQLLEAICKLELEESFHETLLIQYFEVVGRLTTFMLLDSDYLQRCLGAFFQSTGFQHPNPKVRERACYVFSVLLRSKRIRSALGDYVFEVLTSVQPFLSQDEKEFGENNQLSLLEAIGWILNIPSLPLDDKVEHLTQFLQPLMEQYSDLAYSQYPEASSGAQKEAIINTLTHLMAAIERLSKGFGKVDGDEDEGVRALFVQAVDAIVPSVEIFEADLHKGLHMFIHRMIALLEGYIAPFLSSLISGFLQSNDVEDIQDVGLLLVHLIKKFTDEMYPLMNEFLEPFIQKVFSFTSQELDSVEVDRMNSQRTLLKAFYSLVAVIVNNGLSTVFISEENSSFCYDLFQTILQGVSLESNGSREKKCCLAIIRSTVRQWLTPAGECVDDVADTCSWLPSFVQADVVETCFSAISTPSFRLKDAQCFQVVSEAGALLLAVHAMYGDDFVDYLRTTFLPEYEVGDNTVVHLLSTMQESQKLPGATAKKAMAKALQRFALAAQAVQKTKA